MVSLKSIMNILIFSWRGPGHPNAGGAELSTHEHAKAWVKAGHSVTLFTSDFTGGKHHEVMDGVEIIREGSDIFGVQMKAFFWYLFGKHSKFDLVIDQFHGIPFFTPIYVKAKKLGFIHEVAKEVWWLNTWPKPINLVPGLLGTLFESSIFKLFYHHMSFMTVSESTRNDLVEWEIPPSNITVVHNGVNIIFTKSKKEKIKTVIYLGALAKDKGIEDAIRTFAEISKSNTEFKFWVVGWGSPDYLSKLKKHSKDLGIESKIKFWGFVNNKKKFELLARAHILVNPSVREGWGLVNIESCAMGTPVVGYNVAGTRDSVIDGKTGLLTTFGDYQSLAKKIVYLINNKILYENMRKRAIAWAKKFTWKKSTKESLDLIESM